MGASADGHIWSPAPTLADDSPLRLVPASLIPRQKFAIDGLRFAVEAAGVFFARLLHNLERASAEETIPGVAPLLFADAWAFVDSVHRFRRFVDKLAEGPLPSWAEAFLAESESAEALRHTIQHLHTRHAVPELLASNEPLMGTLIWVHSPSESERLIVAAVPGILRESTSIELNMDALVASAKPPIDHVFLTGWEPRHGEAAKFEPLPHANKHARAIAVSLSRTFAALREAVQAIEDMLRPRFEGLTVSPVDALVSFKFEAAE